jgi:dTDP-4-amino-4,6-dideoxygalactose transaminase
LPAPTSAPGDRSGRIVPFATPDLNEDEIAAVVAALRSRWITTGPRTKEFEQAVARYVGAPAALAVNSGTAAMHVALKALGVGPGDAVVTSTMTFVSTVHVIEQSGATPVLVDVEPGTLNIDPDRVAEAVATHPSVKALLPVHYGGHPCAMAPLLALAAERGLAVVEDAAHALGAAYRGVPVGAVPEGADDRAVAFSFYATKNLTTAEGGMLTGSAQLVEAAGPWALHGLSRDAWRRYEGMGSWFYDVTVPGFKCNMTDLAAALGLHQLARFDALQARRREIAEAYTAGLSTVPELELPTEAADVTHAWHLYPVRLRLDMLRLDRRAVIDELGRRGVATSVHFIPVHHHTYHRERYGFAREDFPVASAEFERLVSLPLHTRLTDDDVAHVVDVVAGVVTAARR